MMDMQCPGDKRPTHPGDTGGRRQTQTKYYLSWVLFLPALPLCRGDSWAGIAGIWVGDACLPNTQLGAQLGADTNPEAV